MAITSVHLRPAVHGPVTKGDSRPRMESLMLRTRRTSHLTYCSFSFSQKCDLQSATGTSCSALNGRRRETASFPLSRAPSLTTRPRLLIVSCFPLPSALTILSSLLLEEAPCCVLAGGCPSHELLKNPTFHVPSWREQSRLCGTLQLP